MFRRQAVSATGQSREGRSGGGSRGPKCGFSTLLRNVQHVKLLNVIQRNDLFPTKIPNNRDRALVTAIEIFCQCSDVPIVDSVEGIRDRLIDYGRVFGSHMSLKNAGSSDILANNIPEIFGLTKRILLKPKFKILAQCRNKWNSLQPAPLAWKEETPHILCIDELGAGIRGMG